MLLFIFNSHTISKFEYRYTINIYALHARMRAGSCTLNFTSYPYQPSGECIKKEEKIKAWGSLTTTACCRNALIALSRALARQARDKQDSVFITQDQWTNCSAPFVRQRRVSVTSCGFDDLYYGGKTRCSNLTMPSIRSSPEYHEAFQLCSSLDVFEDTCPNCTSAVLKLGTALLKLAGAKRNDKNEIAVCGIAAVISVTVKIYDNNQDFYGCLTGLDKSGNNSPHHF